MRTAALGATISIPTRRGGRAFDEEKKKKKKKKKEEEETRSVTK
jgi:hypothetical protein